LVDFQGESRLSSGLWAMLSIRVNPRFITCDDPLE
jgi:hypothetical protein